jgi:hypothetical protein
MKRMPSSNIPVIIQLHQQPDAKSQLWDKEGKCLEHRDIAGSQGPRACSRLKRKCHKGSPLD